MNSRAVYLPLALIGGVVGVFLGSRVAGRLSHVALRRVFAAVVVAMAALLLLDPFGAR